MTRATVAQAQARTLSTPLPHLRVLASHLPLVLGGTSRTELLRHLRVPACESSGQRCVAIPSGLIEVHPRRSEQSLHHNQVSKQRALSVGDFKTKTWKSVTKRA